MSIQRRRTAVGLTILMSLALVIPVGAHATDDEPSGIYDELVMESAGITEAELREYAARDQELMDEAIRENVPSESSSVGEDRTIAPTFGEIGEIWVSPASKTSGSAALVGHAAIVSTNIYVTVESYPLRFSPAERDGVQYLPNTWIVRPGAKILLGNKVSSPAMRTNAAQWAEDQVGKPYNWNFFNKYDTTRFYCSQLVWMAWLKQGNNIDYIPADMIVTPAEIVKSPATITRWSTNG